MLRIITLPKFISVETCGERCIFWLSRAYEYTSWYFEREIKKCLDKEWFLSCEGRRGGGGQLVVKAPATGPWSCWLLIDSLCVLLQYILMFRGPVPLSLSIDALRALNVLFKLYWGVVCISVRWANVHTLLPLFTTHWHVDLLMCWRGLFLLC